MKAKRSERDISGKKGLAEAGKRIREDARRSMSRKEGNALLAKMLRQIEAA